jgi:hypothetical protein
MRYRLLAVATVASVLVVSALAAVAESPEATAADELRPARSFSSIADDAERAAALFEEAGKVLLHPRCINCHPAGDVPLQGEGEGQLHEPLAVRGRDNHGVVGMRCDTCHLDRNFNPGEVPGAPHWHLAPRSMAWEGLTLGELCEQVQDPERNGGRSLREVVRHMAEDELVAWAWEPGRGREPAPGTQKAFAELIRAWADAGAGCP